MSFHTPQARKKRVKQIAKVAPGVVTTGMAGAIAFSDLTPLSTVSALDSTTMDRTQAPVEQQYIPQVTDIEPSPEGELPEGWYVSHIGYSGTKVLKGPQGQMGLDIPMGGDSNYPQSVSVWGEQDRLEREEAAKTPFDITTFDMSQFIKDTWNTEHAEFSDYGRGVAQEAGKELEDSGFTKDEIEEGRKQAELERIQEGVTEGGVNVGTIDLTYGPTQITYTSGKARWNIEDPGTTNPPGQGGQFYVPGTEGKFQSASHFQTPTTPEDAAKIRTLIKEYKTSRIGQLGPEIPEYMIGDHTKYPIPDVPQIVQIPTVQPVLLEITPQGIDYLEELSSSSDNSRTQNEDRKTLRLFNTIGSIPQGDPLIKPMQATIRRLQEAQLLGPSDEGVNI